MKSGLTLKFMLKATLACALLTCVEFIFDNFTSFNHFSHRDFEMIIVWIVLSIAWIIFFLEYLHKPKQDK